MAPQRRSTVVADRFVRYGLPGESDVTGIAGGIRLEIEVKAAKDKPTPDQVRFLEDDPESWRHRPHLPRR
jgi:hypothetical protein